MEKTVLTVSRRWSNPQISTTISSEGIGIQMDIDDFKTALLKEVGYWLTKSKLDKAVEEIIKGIKEESAKVV